MKITEKFLQAHNFKLHSFGQYVRFYDAIAIMVVFDILTREFFAVHFRNEDEIVSYQAGDFSIVYDKEIIYDPKIQRRKGKIDLIERLNIRRLEIQPHFLEALYFFEKQFIESV